MTEQQTDNNSIFKVLAPSEGGYSFCWGIEYLNGVVKKGGWNCDVNDVSMQAWRQSSNNILRAFITAMDKHRVKHRVAECPGPEFFGFEWIYTGRLAGFGAVKSRICGLTLLTQTERVAVYESGQAKVTPFDSQLINKYPQGRV